MIFSVRNFSLFDKTPIIKHEKMAVNILANEQTLIAECILTPIVPNDTQETYIFNMDAWIYSDFL